ncbi:nuclear transport factor 2 family protein [Peribacillus muralis]|uniref:nuclear transport factor 2 family protein n=1 Tax=Peribacillus muralis TaxID=264697 RepID=UPI003672B237
MILKRPTVNTQQDLLDKASVKELIEFERFCRDNALWNEMDKCFTSDSKITISWFQGTGHEFVEASKKMPGRAPHKIYNTEIWLNGDKAVAIMIATIQKRIDINGYPVELNSDAKLVFSVQKINGQWYIVSMEGIYEKDSLVPVYPNASITVPVEEISKFRESYACLSYVLSQDGYDIADDLPGIDRPDLVEAFYKKTDEWLSK